MEIIGFNMLHTLKNVWRCYRSCCEAGSSSVTVQAASYRTFCQYWLDLLPYIVVSKPRSDLCWVCHQHSTSLSKLSNKPDDEKVKVSTKYSTVVNVICTSLKILIKAHYYNVITIVQTYHLWTLTVSHRCFQVIDAARDHMSTVTSERSLYREVYKSSREAVKAYFKSGETFNPPAPGSLIAPASNHVKVHYSFDMAQQVHKI